VIECPAWVGWGWWKGASASADETEDQYVFLDLLQKYVSGLDRARRSKIMAYATVRSFFMHNRCALPQDPAFRIQSARSTAPSKLTLANIVDVVKNATLRDRSVLLMKWQGLLDSTRLAYVGQRLAEEVVKYLRLKIQ